MFKEIDVIKDLALKYSKPQLGRMAQLGMIEPQKAMMAGMMRDRIAKEDAKPPTATVAQDVLGLQPPQQQAQPQQMGMPQMAQVQGQPQQAPQPQMGMPQSEQPPMGATQMAATGGLTSLPVPEQNYAGGGIIAFDEGGEIPRYQGNPVDGSLVRDDVFAQPRPSLLFNFGSDKAEDPAVLQQKLAQAESALAQTPPSIARVGLEKQVNELRAEVASMTPVAQTRDITAPATAPATAPVLDQSTAETARLLRQNAGAPADMAAALTTGQARATTDKAPVRERTPGVDGGPRLPAIARPSTDIAVEKTKVGNVKDIDEILKEREDIYKKQGIVDPYAGLMEKEEKKREGITKRKGEAKGEFLMNLGLGLMSAKRGREIEALGAGAKEGLASFKESMKDVRAAEEKLEDRVNAYKLAEYNAKKTGTDSAIAKRDTMLDKRDAAEAEFTKAVNAANADKAKINAQVYGDELRSKTSLDTTRMQVQGNYGLEKLRQQAMPEIMKVADSQQMKEAMPNSTFFERVQAYSKAAHPRDIQNSMVIATTQATKAANEEWANELLYNKPLIELKKKADAGDKAAATQLQEKRDALDKYHLNKRYGEGITQPQSGSAQEGATSTDTAGAPIVFRNGQWVYK
jgi:hypothetical protein